jgi:hypothetical protein
LVLIIGVVLALAPTALAAATVPVPSLTPAATAKLWRAEVARARAAPQARLDLTCTPSRAVFYAQTDWLRLATKLAQTPSPCSQYFVSVPPLAADKTQARPGQAASIRALGADFHAVDEISYTGWSGWVGAGSGTWYDAGVAARDRMAAAGFDVSAGDTWALNELSSAVRRGTAAARGNALDFLHGLAADGTKGIVFAAGVGQSTPDPSQYKVNLQDWLQDSSFWTEVSAYVSDFAPENYGDVRNYAVPGTSPQQRRDALLQYLAHEGALANAGPASTAAARSVLGQTYVTFGNAAWAWDSAYGWTSVPLGTMQDFVSGQVYAARSFAHAAGEAVDRFGFAWSPNNTLGLSTADFNTQTASLLDRIAAAIRDTSVPSVDAGSAACAPAWCTTTLAGAAFAPQWQQFATWSPTVPAFTSAPFSATAGTPSGPVTVELQTLGMADNAVADRTLTLASDSQTGAFALASGGPWSPTLTLTIPAGSADVSVFYSDTAAGSPTLTARLDDGSLATQSEQVTAPAAPPAPAPAPTPAPAPAPAPAPSTPPATTTTPTTAAPVTVPPAATPAAPPPPPHISWVRTRVAGGHVVVSVAVVAGTSHPSGVRVRIRVRRGARTIALVTRVTTRGGLASWRSAKKLPRGRYVATAAAIR